MTFGRIVIGRNVFDVNTHKLTESDFRFLCHTLKMAAMMSFHAEKCCHLVSEHEAVPCPYAVAYANF